MSYREGRSVSPPKSRLPAERPVFPPKSRLPAEGRRSRSLSRSRRERSRSRDSGDVVNPGNNLYIMGLSTRVTSSDLEKFFSNEGKVTDCHLVKDPQTKESRGFAFVTMATNEDADRCIKHLNRTVLEGRLVTVEKAKRKRGRTPTPGKYQGAKDKHGDGRRRSRSYSPRQNERDRYSRQHRGRSRSPYSRRTDGYNSHNRHGHRFPEDR
ncbi:Serine/arginine-rich splicing factor SR45a [Heracleum sosnowskyi]|uniref:Serine/arginine-rich splicing factor SR45a n=1 Tax=Heracleum sosnowskyi TaxID=360622 RepID=A0AAD8MJX5_9APIA|nr:Serine/arginine-rich splicing factor SR45a [Heracleum sosnowskyi]